MIGLLQRWTRPLLSRKGHSLLDRVIQSGQWSYGPVAHQIEREVSHRVQVENVLLTNSGTSALWLALTSLKRKEKQAIIVPAFGYSAAANVAAALGYELYIADSIEGSPVVDPRSVNRLIDKNVAAIIGINYFGYSVDWDEISTGEDYKIIEDAAGSYGAKYKERTCGSNAEIAIFSFHTSKAVAAGGEGGAIVSNNKEFIDRARSAARSGHTTGYYYSDKIGMNMFMSDVAASFLQDTIRSYDELPELRKKAVEAIDKSLARAGHETVDFNHSQDNRQQNYQAYTLLTDNRDLVLKLLRVNGFESRPCWPYLITELPATQSAVKKVDGDLANAKYFADHIINIPVNPLTSDTQVQRFDTLMQRLSDQEIMLYPEPTSTTARKDLPAPKSALALNDDTKEKT